jgi:hypothetical protein
MKHCQIGTVYHKCSEIFRGWNISFNVSHTVYSFGWSCVFKLCCGAGNFVDPYQAYIVHKFIVQIILILLCNVCTEKNLICYTTSRTSATLCLRTQTSYIVFVVSLCVPCLAHTSWFKHTNSIGWEYKYSEFSSWNFLHRPCRFKYCQHCALRAQVTWWIRS